MDFQRDSGCDDNFGRPCYGCWYRDHKHSSKFGNHTVLDSVLRSGSVALDVHVAEHRSDPHWRNPTANCHRKLFERQLECQFSELLDDLKRECRDGKQSWFYQLSFQRKRHNHGVVHLFLDYIHKYSEHHSHDAIRAAENFSFHISHTERGRLDSSEYGRHV